MKMKRTIYIALLVCLVVASAVQADQMIDETRAANGDVRVEIELLSGSVIVKGGETGELHITGTMGDDVEMLRIEGDSDHWQVEVKIPEHRTSRDKDFSADLEITLPHGASVDVESVSAEIEVTDVRGDLDLESVSGEVVVSGAAGDVDVETVSGSVEVAGNGSSMEVESVSGSVNLAGAAGTVEAATVSGRIEVDAMEISRASFESVSGSVHFAGRISPDAHLNVESHSGNVVLTIPADTSAEISVETFSGSIDNGFGPAADKTSKYTPGYSLDFSMGTGEARIDIDTFSGSVELKSP